MAFERYSPEGFDQCNPPFCAQDIKINVTSYGCNGGIFSVYWEISDLYNRSLSVTSNELRWSVNSDSCDNRLSSVTNTEPYYVIMSSPPDNGTIYFKIRMTIENTFVDSEIYSVNLEDCKSISGCPSDWTDDISTGYRKANFYIEYTTYNARDRIRVYGNFSEDCCGSTPPSSCTLLWDSTCAGTSRRTGRSSKKTTQFPMDCSGRTCEDGGEGVGHYLLSSEVRSSTTKNKDGVKADCFEVDESLLPIGVLVDPLCGDEANTEWFVYIEGPENFVYYKEGKNEGSCGDIEVPGGYVMQAQPVYSASCDVTPGVGNLLYVRMTTSLRDAAIHSELIFKYDDPRAQCWRIASSIYWYSPQWTGIPERWVSGSLNTVIIDASEALNNLYPSREACCGGSNLCPTSWEIDPATGTNAALFYIEYNTGSGYRNIKIYSNHVDGCCDEDNQGGDLLWESGCVSTLNPVLAAGESVTLSQLLNKNDIYAACDPSSLRSFGSGYRIDCFYVHQSQLPLCGKIISDCSGYVGNEPWYFFIYGPDNYCLFKNGGSNDECTISTDNTTDSTDNTDHTTDSTDNTDHTDHTTDSTDNTDHTTDSTDNTDHTDHTTDSTDNTDHTTDSTDNTDHTTDSTDNTDHTDHTTDSTTDSTIDSTTDSTDNTDHTTDSTDNTDHTTDSTDNTDHTDHTTVSVPVSSTISGSGTIGSGTPGSSGGPFAPFVFYKYSDEEAQKIYEQYAPMLENKTQAEKEEILIQLVVNGEINPDQAILIAVRAGLSVDT